METIFEQFPRLFTELDAFLIDFIAQNGSWIHGLLFVIVFCETGLVVTPFLPGDSLLFAVGAISARSTTDGTTVLDLGLAAGAIFVAAILGDTVNYHIGRWIGPPAFTSSSRWFKREYLLRTHAFFERRGSQAIVLARFVPIVRTFAPFVAGVGTMGYARFLAANVFGAALWVLIVCGAGRLFGDLPFVKRNFSSVVIGIVIVSLLPLAAEWWRHRLAQRRRTPPAASGR